MAPGGILGDIWELLWEAQSIQEKGEHARAAPGGAARRQPEVESFRVVRRWVSRAPEARMT